jgi:probable rRNA maturation factor
VRAALEGPAQIAVRVVGEEEGRRLNREFRGRDYATNVLTFDGVREAGVPVPAHCAHLVVHGVLHARGFDHERAAQARVMESLESALLRALGFDDPYTR